MLDTNTNHLELSIVMPCLNEAETLRTCIEKAFRYMQRYDIIGEVVIGDNGSTDGSVKIAEDCGARVVHIISLGYGNALYGAITAARGRYIICGDSDDSYDFENLHPFIEKLRAGHDMVIGNRFAGEIKPDAMPILHRFLGNPVLSFIGKWFTKAPIGDFHCGLRGITKDCFEKLELQSTGMEFATEMIIKASASNIKMAEIPIILYKDGRSGASHLRTWRDGWRHLRLLLKYSPRYLSFIHQVLLRIEGIDKQEKQNYTVNTDRVVNINSRLEA